jgi:hypothetical protein
MKLEEAEKIAFSCECRVLVKRLAWESKQGVKVTNGTDILWTRVYCGSNYIATLTQEDKTADDWMVYQS